MFFLEWIHMIFKCVFLSVMAFATLSANDDLLSKVASPCWRNTLPPGLTGRSPQGATHSGPTRPPVIRRSSESTVNPLPPPALATMPAPVSSPRRETGLLVQAVNHRLTVATAALLEQILGRFTRVDNGLATLQAGIERVNDSLEDLMTKKDGDIIHEALLKMSECMQSSSAVMEGVVTAVDSFSDHQAILKRQINDVDQRMSQLSGLSSKIDAIHAWMLNQSEKR
jgi:hypothetical protein